MNYNKENYQVTEVPIDVDMLHPGDKVVIAYYHASWSNKPTEYRYGLVNSMSPVSHLVTVGNTRFGPDGYLYTSNQQEKYTRRLLQVTDEMASVIHRKELLQWWHGIVPEIESTITLEVMQHAYNAGKAIDVDDGF